MEAHNSTVSQIAASVKHFHSTNTPFRIYHGSTLSTRPSARTRDNTVDISKLNHVFPVNRDTKTCFVEPNVPMDALVAATMKEDFLPPVVMELPNITVGGGFAGTSGESSSFRYGTFDCTVRSIEVVLGDGSIVTATRGDPETEDLLYGSAGACGTLGIVTLLEIELIESQPYVQLTYWPVRSASSAVELLQKFEQDPAIDFIDGILFSSTSGTIMTGKLSDEIPSKSLKRKVQTFDRATDPWFYLHAEQGLAKHEFEPWTETIPTQSYLFRYDRAVFWSGRLAFKYFHVPFNRIMRFLLNPFMRTRVVNHALHRSGLSSQGIIQDLGIPYSTSAEFIQYISSTLNFWPLWLCPVRSPHALGGSSFSIGKKDLGFPDVMLDIGVWGIGPSDTLQFIRLNRDIEKKVRELGGLKCLYAHAYYTEDEFWEIYNEKEYLDLRRKWRAGGLPSVYDKVKVDLKGVDVKEGVAIGKWTKGNLAQRLKGKVWGVVGVLSAVRYMLFGGDFVLKKAR